LPNTKTTIKKEHHASPDIPLMNSNLTAASRKAVLPIGSRPCGVGLYRPAHRLEVSELPASFAPMIPAGYPARPSLQAVAQSAHNSSP